MLNSDLYRGRDKTCFWIHAAFQMERRKIRILIQTQVKLKRLIFANYLMLSIS